MATRKQRISDLLRQEAQKLPDTEDKSAIDTTAVEVVEKDAKTVEESATIAATESPQDDGSPTKAELEATIAELKAALAQSQKLEIAQQHEVSLQQQVIDLQSELSQQRELVAKLKKDLEEVNSLKSELKKTKEDALQLAEANSKLIEENNLFKKAKEEITSRTYKPIERKIGKNTESSNSDDFANKTWLL